MYVKLTPAQLRAFMAALDREEVPAAIRFDVLRALRNARNGAVREELLTRNVALLVDMPKVTKGRAWAAREAITFLRAAGAHRLCAARTFDRLVKRGPSADGWASGVRRIMVRLVRHTCGTLLAFLKVHPEVARAILRHSQLSRTMNVYTHVVGSDEREAVRDARRAAGRSTHRLMSAMDVKDPQPLMTGGLLAGGANRI